jgi:hypothetical protein
MSRRKPAPAPVGGGIRFAVKDMRKPENLQRVPAQARRDMIRYEWDALYARARG